MHREDNSKFILFIEPRAYDKLNTPIDDELTKVMELALSKATPGASNYSKVDSEPFFHAGDEFRGTHRTECGEQSSNKDYLLENGMIANSLAPFYLKWYRYSIPISEMMKVHELFKFYS